MVQHKKPEAALKAVDDNDAGKAEGAEAAAIATAAKSLDGEEENAPTPTQAEMDEARLNMGRSFSYMTRDGEAE